MNSYQATFMNLDPDGPQYISSNAGDEQSHASFLNAYLQSVGADPVDLDAFRTLSQLVPANSLPNNPEPLNSLHVDVPAFARGLRGDLRRNRH